MFGIGIATKLYPILVLLAIVMLCLRANKLRAAAAAIGGGVVGVAAMYIPAIVLSHQTPAAIYQKSFIFPSATCAGGHPLRGWRWFISLSQTRGTDWGSIWLVFQHMFGNSAVTRTLSPPGLACGGVPTSLNRIGEFSIAVVIVGVLVLVAVARRRPRVAQIAFLLVAGFIMLNKVDSPQYVLWLLPLAVLARPRWAAILIWQISEVVLGAANLYTLISLDHSDQGLPLSAYLVFVVVRDVILLGLMALVVRDVLDPRHDIVRRDGVDDPAGGVLLDSDVGLPAGPAAAGGEPVAAT
jgi:uncharacterized membrane protein